MFNSHSPFSAKFRVSTMRLPFPTPDTYCRTSRISQRQVTQQLTKITAKNKTKPNKANSKPIFWTPNPVLSEKMRIFDKFTTTFLCKTKPIYKNLILSMMYQKTLNIPNKANLKNDQMNVTKVLTTDYNRRTLGIRGKNEPKTKPILTFS